MSVPAWQLPLQAWASQKPEAIGHHPFNRLMVLLIKDCLSSHDRTRKNEKLIDEALKKCPVSAHYPSNNWVLLAQLCRMIEASSGTKRKRETGHLIKMLRQWTTSAGGFIDFPSATIRQRNFATPLAYHHKALFITALALNRTNDDDLLEAASKLYKWALHFWDHNQYLGGFGRSTHSLFGDACLLAGLQILRHFIPRADDQDQNLVAQGVLNRWQGQLRPDGLLNLTPHDAHRPSSASKLAWDHYMHLTVYNGWAAALLSYSLQHSHRSHFQNLGTTLRVPNDPHFSDPDAGLLRLNNTSKWQIHFCTTGQAPQSFDRQEAELRYSGGLPWHAVHDGKPIIPPPARVPAEILLEHPALAGWTPLFLVDGVLFALVSFDLFELRSGHDGTTILLSGAPVNLLKPTPTRLIDIIISAVDWRFARGTLTRKAAFKRTPPNKNPMSAELIFYVSTHQPHIEQRLTIHTNIATNQEVLYLNPGGHSVICSHPPRQRSLNMSSNSIHPEIPGSPPWQTILSDYCSIQEAECYTLPSLRLTNGEYRHHLSLTW